MSACVGFVECPCRGCRIRRVAATEAHPQHTAYDPYCGACRTRDREAHRVR